MIVCLCKKVSCKDIKEAAESGASLDTIISMTNACTCCQKCKEDIEKIILERQNEDADGLYSRKENS